MLRLLLVSTLTGNFKNCRHIDESQVKDSPHSAIRGWRLGQEVAASLPGDPGRWTCEAAFLPAAQRHRRGGWDALPHVRPDLMQNHFMG
jgi:hypothetical protein